jgi:hypothetical protein
MRFQLNEETEAQDAVGIAFKSAKQPSKWTDSGRFEAFWTSAGEWLRFRSAIRPDLAGSPT